MINVTKSYLPPLEKYEAYLDEIFRSGILTNNGELVKKLEKELCAYLGVKNLILVSSGTLALQVAYKLLNLKGEVITTPFSFVATVSSQAWEGLNPAFVDIDKDSFNIDTSLLVQNITHSTSAIIPVHVFGNSCDVEKLQQISTEKNLNIIYDAAHAFGVKFKGQSILNYGDISTLSFHATKVFHTIEGGALIVNDDALYEKARLMINFGISGPESIQCLGINAKMNEFQAAMGLCILDAIDEIIAQRKKVFDYYVSNLSGSVTLQKHEKNSTQNYSYMPVLFEDEAILEKVVSKLRRNGINPRRYFYPCLSNLNYIKDNPILPQAEDISKRILCLPLYDSLSLADTERIVSIVNSGV